MREEVDSELLHILNRSAMIFGGDGNKSTLIELCWVF